MKYTIVLRQDLQCKPPVPPARICVPRGGDGPVGERNQGARRQELGRGRQAGPEPGQPSVQGHRDGAGRRIHDTALLRQQSW